MRKRLLTILFIMTIMLPFIKVKAAYMDSYIDWELDRGIFAHQYRNGEEHVTNLAMITANGIPAYCIEPGIVADKASYYSSTTNISDTNLGSIDTRRLSLIGHYGYGYYGRNSQEYYMATQELIWREMGVENVWWSDSKYGGIVFDIESYKRDILKSVDEYEIAPKFNFKDKYIVGDEISLRDINETVYNYDVIGNDDVYIDNYNIVIKVKEGNNNFTLRRKQNGKNTKFYYKDGYQTIGSFEFPYDYEVNYNINHTYGKIIVDKFDKETKTKNPISKYATLEGAEYGLYDNAGNLLMKKKTDKNGMIVFDGLPKNNYMVKELSPSKGYLIDKSVNKTFVGTGTLEVTIKSYEDIIKNKVYITKVLDDVDNKMCIPEEGIKFYIYDEEGNFILETVTDENGNIMLELPYGKYILKQITTPDGVDKVEDRVIEVTSDGIVQNVALVNHKLPIEKIEVPPIITLPNTGNNDILYLTLLISLTMVGFIYEKKYS